MKRLWRRVPRRLRNLCRLVAVVCLLKSIDLALRLTSYRQVSRWLLLLSPTPNPTRVNLHGARATARIINAAARMRLVQATCLRRSLALWWILRWLSIPSALRFGVNKTGGHAWVEHDHEVINDRPDVSVRYSILYQDELKPEVMATLVKVVDTE